MLKGPRNSIAVILTALVLAACQGLPPPADGVAYTRREQANNQRIQANNNAIAGAAVVGLAAGALIGTAVANNRYNHNSYYNPGYYGSPYGHHYRRCYRCW